MFRHIILIAVLFYSQFGFGQRPNYSIRDLTAVDFTNYTETVRYGLYENVYQLIISSDIKAFADAGLKQEYSVSDFKRLGESKTTVKVIDPEKPNDISALWDSIVILRHDGANSLGFRILGRNLILFRLTSTDSVFLDFAKLKKKLTKEENVFFEFYINRGIDYISIDTDKKFVPDEFSRYSEKVYNLGRSGNAKAYKNDSLTSYYDTAGIQLREKVYQYVIPYGDIMSAAYKVVRYYNTKEIPSLRFFEEWQPQGADKYGVVIVAVAPIFFPVTSGLETTPTPLFLLKKTEISQYFENWETEFYTYLSKFHLENTSELNKKYNYPFDNYPLPLLFDE